MNVGSGGGAAAAPAAGGASGGGAAAAEETKEEEKEEGTALNIPGQDGPSANVFCREGRIGRGYGLRSLRLDYFWISHLCTSQCMATVTTVQYMAGRVAFIDKHSLRVSANTVPFL